MDDDMDQKPTTVTREPGKAPHRNHVRAAIRAETREPVRAEPARDGVRRRRKNVNSLDRFHIDPRLIPPGMTYEWKRVAVMGAPDPSYDMHMLEQGWEPVDSSRHPQMVAAGHKGAIIRDGMMLMERPVELTAEARQEEYDAARDAIRTRERQMSDTPDGTLTRDHPTARPKIGKSYEPIAVPDD